MDRLADKVALVSGAGSGIGEAIATRFVIEGARVLFTDIDEDVGRAAAARAGGEFLQQDVSRTEHWRAVLDCIQDRFGRLDILVNNAGIVCSQSIANIDLDSWNRVLAVNLTGSLLGCQSAIRLMRQHEPVSGSIINLGSTTSFLGLPEDVAYTASKAGILGLTKSVSTWCARNGLDIRCNSLHPGPIYTSILRKQVEEHPELYDKFCNMTPLGRMGTVEEIANLALFLASDESSFTTGAQFVADGGTTSAHPTM
jgi:3alpha(or 20beta)-hydroxysteroid dehydrogenase